MANFIKAGTPWDWIWGSLVLRQWFWSFICDQSFVVLTWGKNQLAALEHLDKAPACEALATMMWGYDGMYSENYSVYTWCLSQKRAMFHGKVNNVEEPCCFSFIGNYKPIDEATWVKGSISKTSFSSRPQELITFSAEFAFKPCAWSIEI